MVVGTSRPTWWEKDLYGSNKEHEMRWMEAHSYSKLSCAFMV